MSKKEGWDIFIEVSFKIPVFAESRAQAKRDAKDVIIEMIDNQEKYMAYRIEQGVTSKPIQATTE